MILMGRVNFLTLSTVNRPATGHFPPPTPTKFPTPPASLKTVDSNQ